MEHHNIDKFIDECSFLQTSQSVTPVADRRDHSIDPLCIDRHPSTMEDPTVDIQSYSFSGGCPFITSSIDSVLRGDLL